MPAEAEGSLKWPLARRFAGRWESGQSPPDVFAFLAEHPEAGPEEQAEVLRVDLVRRWQSGQPVAAEYYVDRCPAVARNAQLQVELAVAEYLQRWERAEPVAAERFCDRFPHIREVLAQRLIEVAKTLEQTTTADMRSASVSITISGSPTGPAPPLQPEAADPESVGRYRIIRRIGQGNFGRVYLARDPGLERLVAIKMAHAEWAAGGEQTNQFLAEGRTLANLDHPHIVPVYDVGTTEDGASFVVSKYIDGSNLQSLASKEKLPYQRVASLLADVADALSYAHVRGVVHRDVKPANILLDKAGEPFLGDFGLALWENQQRRRAGEVSGTPAYMAPEQVRGRAHQLDGRADIWALGVILYELLTGRRPFSGRDRNELFDEILSRDPKPPRQIDPAIPQPLEAICLKCLAKSPSHRYTTAADLASALRRWKQEAETPAAHPPRRYLVVAAGGVALMLIVLTVWCLRLLRPSPPPPPMRPADTQSVLAAEVLEEIRQLRANLTERQGQVPQASGRQPSQGEPDFSHLLRDGLIMLPEGFADVEKRINRARQAGDEAEEFDALLAATNGLIDAGRYQAAEALAQRMVQLAGNDPSRRPFAYGQLGLAQYRGGRAEQAIDNLYESMKTYRTLYDQLQVLPGNPTVQGHLSHLARLIGITLTRVGNAYKQLEQFENAEKAYEEARNLLEKHARTDELADLLTSYGSLESQRGNHQKAIELLEEGIELARKHSDAQAEADLLVNLGNALSRAGDNPSALARYEMAAERMGPDASYESRTALLINWALTLALEGQLEKAKPLIAQLQSIARPDDRTAQRVLELLSPATNP